MQPEDDGPERILSDLLEVTRMAKAREDWNAAIRACELRGRHQGMFQSKGGASGLDGTDIVERYRAARERADQAQRAHDEGKGNVVPLRRQ